MSPVPEVALAAPQLTAGDLAAIVFSSGTSGLFKGVRLMHGNLAASAAQVAASFALDGTYDSDSVTLAGVSSEVRIDARDTRVEVSVDLSPWGLAVGHATDDDGATGLTVVRGVDAAFHAGAAVLGRATGTRELLTVSPEHLVDRVDAILLTGGSAYGLDAAAGVSIVRTNVAMMPPNSPMPPAIVNIRGTASMTNSAR